jgi:hypothetical protein
MRTFLSVDLNGVKNPGHGAWVTFAPVAPRTRASCFICTFALFLFSSPGSPFGKLSHMAEYF